MFELQYIQGSQAKQTGQTGLLVAVSTLEVASHRVGSRIITISNLAIQFGDKKRWAPGK